MNADRLAAFKHASNERIRTLTDERDEHMRCIGLIDQHIAIERDFVEQYEREGSYVAPKPANREENTTDDGFDEAQERKAA